MRGVLAQLLSVTILSIINVLSGVAVTWSSYTTELLTSDSSPLGFKASISEVSIITSCIMIGSLGSTCGGAYMSDSIGRKKSELTSGLFITLSWALIATAKSITQIIIGRFIYGLALGIHLAVSFGFVNEISQTAIRGTMTALLTFSFSLGCIMSYLTGWFCSYDVVNYIYLSLSVSSVVLLYFVRESPVYLLSEGKFKEALDSLKYYRGTSHTTPDILEELDYFMGQLKNYRQKSMTAAYGPKFTVAENQELNATKSAGSSLNKMNSFKKLFTNKPSRRAITIITLHLIVGIFTGALVVQSYAARLFTAVDPSLSPHFCSVILAVSIAVGCMGALSITDLVGRRTLIIWSSIICTACLGVLSSLLRWHWAPAWITPALILAYCCFYQAGVINVPIVQMSESFYPEVRSAATAVCMSVTFLVNFVILGLFAPAVEYLGLDGTFFIFFVICTIFTIMAFLTTKETRCVSVEDIQDIYERGWFYWN